MSNAFLPLFIAGGIYFLVKKSFPDVGYSGNTPTVEAPVFTIPKTPISYATIIDETQNKYGIPFNFLYKMLDIESNHFDEKVIYGLVDGPSGEKGIAQLMPKWHPNVEYFNPKVAVDYAGSFLKSLYNQFGDWSLAIMAYNWGSGNVQKWIDAGAKWDDVNSITKNYVTKVTAL